MRGSLTHPTRLIPLGFLGAVILGTLLLMLPFARIGNESAPFLTALFTATSAVCVTGLIVVDTPTYWSHFGQGVILLLIQIGGFGLMTGATLLGMLVSRRLRLATSLIAQAETRSLALGDIRSVVKVIFVATLVAELVIAVILTLQLRLTYNEAWPTAIWNGVFQSVSAFNNAGFSTYSDSLMGFVTDPIIILAIMVAVIVGGVGFPVIHEIRKAPTTPQRWSLHTKITLVGTLGLLVFGTLVTLVYEWSNPDTLGPLDAAGKLLASAFHSTMTRTAGFNSVDVGAMQPGTLAISQGLMMIGGGSAGTAGGIKVTTFVILGLVVWSEIRGEPDVVAFRRRIATETQRQALTVVLISVGLVAVSVAVLLSVSTLPFDALAFEAISAFATVGLSTGITADLPPAGQIVIVVLMFIGRVGTITFATALALRARRRPFRYPEERPIVG